MPSVLIIGGGFAGLTAAQTLRKSALHSVTLVDRKDYFEVSPAQLHQLVSPDSLGDRPRFPYRQVLGDAFVQGEVAALEDRTAVLKDGQRLPFDTLILATGTRYPRLPLAKPNTELSIQARRDSMALEHRRFQEAKGFLVVGGGVVGVELAGELVTASKGKPVRLAHKGARLVENLSPQASAEALKQLRDLGVTAQLNTSDAKPTAEEVLYDATSPEPSSNYLTALQPSVLDPRGRILVDGTLQVKGHPNWYAVGDVNAAPLGKMAVSAASQGEWVAKRLLGSNKPFKPMPTMAIVPLGPVKGFSELPFGMVKWKLLLNMKRKDYLVERIRGSLGAS